MTRRLPPSGRPERRTEDARPGELGRQINDPVLVRCLKAADVVLGFDPRDPDHAALFYGRRLAQRIKATGITPRMSVCEVPIDFASDDLEVLIALCIAHKGSCCYQSCGGDEAPMISPLVN